MLLRSSHLVRDRLCYFGEASDDFVRSLCQDHVFPSCRDFISAPKAQATREHRWRHIEQLRFEFWEGSGLGSSMETNPLKDDVFQACSVSDYAEAMLVAAFPPDCIHIVAATAYLVPFLFDPASPRPSSLAHTILDLRARLDPLYTSPTCMDVCIITSFSVSTRTLTPPDNQD